MKKQTNFTILTLVQRIILNATLPVEGGFTQLIILREIRKKIEITEKEVVEYEIKDAIAGNGNAITQFNNKKAGSAKFKYEFSEAQKLQFRTFLQGLIDKKKLPDTLLDLAIEMKCTERKPDLKKVDE